jgi:hypothetical protein
MYADNNSNHALRHQILSLACQVQFHHIRVIVGANIVISSNIQNIFWKNFFSFFCTLKD